MSGRVLYGKEFAEQIKAEAKNRMKKCVSLDVIVVGDNKASKIYVNNKQKICTELGIKSEVHYLPENVDLKALNTIIDVLNYTDSVDGFFLQLPLPKHLLPYTEEIINRIDPKKDVDGLTAVNLGKLISGQSGLVPCTAMGCMYMLEKANIPIEGKHAVVIGRSNIVGKPMASLLLNKNATVTICHSKTKDLAKITKTADILVVAIGKPKFVTADMVKTGAVVIDVGINRTDDGIVGDVDFEAVKEKASAITPVPKGVGLLTTATLMLNAVKASEN